MGLDTVIRVKLPNGVVRVNINGVKTTDELVAKIAQRLNVECEDISNLMTLDSTVIEIGAKTPISKYGIERGTELSLTSMVNVNVSEMSRLNSGVSSAILSQMSSQGSVTSGHDRNKNEESSKKVKKHNDNGSDEDDDSDNRQSSYLPFDTYLAENDFCVHSLPLNMDYKAKELTRGAANTLPPAITLKRQKYRFLQRIEFMNVAEVNDFLRYCLESIDPPMPQRMGWIFGYYKEDSTIPNGIRAICECIYEPPQRVRGNGYSLEEDVLFPSVKKLASSLNLEIIGRLVCHPPREFNITAQEAMIMAKDQLDNIATDHYTGYPCSTFFTCSIGYKVNESLELDPTVKCFILSDLGVATVRDGMFAQDQSDSLNITLKSCKKGWIQPKVLDLSKTVTEFDIDWLLTPIPSSMPKKINSLLHTCTFPKENRSVKRMPGMITEHINKIKNGIKGTDDTWKLVADFHLLLYILELFDLETAQKLSTAVSSRSQPESGLIEILTLLN